MAYIAKHGDKWRAQVAKNGVRRTAVWATKREAIEWASRIEAQASLESKTLGGPVRSFQQAIDHYLATVSTAKKEGAVQWERRRFEAMAEFFGPKTALAKVDSARIGQWRDARLETVSASTVLREYNLLRNLLTLARTEWKWIKENPCEGVRMPKEEEDTREDMIWRWQDIRRILRFCQASYGEKTRQMGRAFHIALRTGLRLKEVLAFRFDGQVILLEDSKTTKRGKLVKVPTTRQGRRVLQRYGSVDFDGTANEASVVFYDACVACGIRRPFEDGVTFHDSRATALTHMSRRMPVQVLQKISRHRNINILINRYYRESAEQIAARL